MFTITINTDKIVPNTSDLNGNLWALVNNWLIRGLITTKPNGELTTLLIQNDRDFKPNAENIKAIHNAGGIIKELPMYIVANIEALNHTFSDNLAELLPNAYKQTASGKVVRQLNDWFNSTTEVWVNFEIQKVQFHTNPTDQWLKSTQIFSLLAELNAANINADIQGLTEGVDYRLDSENWKRIND